MRYQVSILPSALRALNKLDRTTKRRISAVIDGLAKAPRPSGSVKMRGDDDTWRLRVGDYRVVYTIEDRIVTVYVVAIGRRRRDIHRKR